MNSNSSRQSGHNPHYRDNYYHNQKQREASSTRHKNEPYDHERRPHSPPNNNRHQPQSRNSSSTRQSQPRRKPSSQTNRPSSNSSRPNSQRPNNQRPSNNSRRPQKKNPPRRRNLLGPFIFLAVFAVACILVFRACSASTVNMSKCELEFESQTLIIGETSRVSLTGLPEDFTGEVLWSSSDTSIITISDGVMEAKEKGSATIAAYVDEKNITATVQVVDVSESVQSIKLNYNNIEMISGRTFQLESTVMLVNNQESPDIPVLWSSSNPSIARVTNDGLVTARDIGTASITATVGNQSAVCMLSVKEDTTSTPASNPAGTEADPLESLPEEVLEANASGLTATNNIPVTGLALSPSFGYLCIDETITLDSAVSPSSASLTWISSKPEVASVSATGVVTAKSIGSTIITVTAGQLTATCAIEVTAQP